MRLPRWKSKRTVDRDWYFSAASMVLWNSLMCYSNFSEKFWANSAVYMRKRQAIITCTSENIDLHFSCGENREDFHFRFRNENGFYKSAKKSNHFPNSTWNTLQVIQFSTYFSKIHSENRSTLRFHFFSGNFWQIRCFVQMKEMYILFMSQNCR